MQVYGEQEVSIADLVCSDDFAARLERASVRAMADSIAKVGLIHPPLVRARDGAVGPGEDRIAAHVLLGRPTVVARLIECTDEELDAMREQENAVRRKESAAELAAMVALHIDAPADIGAATGPIVEMWDVAPPAELVAEVAAAVERDDRITTRRRGRPRTPKNAAVAKVAGDTGRSPEAIRKALEREQARQQAGAVETWGRPQPEAWLEHVSDMRATLTEGADKLKITVARLKRSRTLGIPMDELREQLREAGRAIRGARPAAVCAWCKNLPDLVGNCTACKGLGWISEELAEQIPEALRDPRQVMVQGFQYEVPMPEPVVEELAPDPFGPPDFPEEEREHIDRILAITPADIGAAPRGMVEAIAEDADRRALDELPAEEWDLL